MEEIMLQAKYPVAGSTDFVEVSISQPKIDTHPPHTAYFCTCKISAPNFEKTFDVYGIDPLQSTWISLRQIRVEITEFEKVRGIQCDYHYFQDFEK